MEEEKIYMLTMEEELEKDANGSYRKDLTDQLAEHLAEVKRAMDSGLSPDEFSGMQKLKQALEAATEVVEKYWESAQSLQP
jgi:type III secretion system YseE family protein